MTHIFRFYHFSLSYETLFHNSQKIDTYNVKK
jgi:hypothetical protein